MGILLLGVLALALPPPLPQEPPAFGSVAPPRTVRIQVDVPEELIRELQGAGYDWRQKGRWELAGDRLVLSYDVGEPHDGDAAVRGAASGHSVVDPGPAAR